MIVMSVNLLPQTGKPVSIGEYETCWPQPPT